MDETKGDVSLVYRGYIVRHILKIMPGWEMKKILATAMAEVEKQREIVGAIVVNQDYIPIIRNWAVEALTRSAMEEFESLRTGYIGTIWGADFYIDCGLTPDEIALIVYGEHDRIIHLFRVELETI